MVDSSPTRRKRVVQILGAFFIFIGLIGLCLTSIALSTNKTSDAGLSFIVQILTLVTGVLLVCFKPNKAANLILFLRVFFLLSLFAVINGLLYWQFNMLACPTVLLALIIAAMVILFKERAQVSAPDKVN